MKTIGKTATSDAVSDLLDAVRVRTTVFCRSEMRAPWGFGVRAHGNPSFHVVTQGACCLEVDGTAEPFGLREGDLVVLPHGPLHWLRDRPESPTEWLDDILATTPIHNGRLHYGQEGDRAEIVCGGFVLEGDTANPILRELPELVHVGGSGRAPAAWVAATLDMVAAVTASDGPGSQAVLTRLADAMLTQALRVALASTDGLRARALRDPQIGTAIHLIHEHPEEPWTIERLASEVGYSRSAFAARFRELVGESPIAYVTRTRLADAAIRLQRSNMSIAEVAVRAGYSSSASLTRAFKRSFGVAPGAYRT